MLSILLTFGTFMLTYGLNMFRRTPYFTATVLFDKFHLEENFAYVEVYPKWLITQTGRMLSVVTELNWIYFYSACARAVQRLLDLLEVTRVYKQAFILQCPCRWYSQITARCRRQVSWKKIISEGRKEKASPFWSLLLPSVFCQQLGQHLLRNFVAVKILNSQKRFYVTFVIVLRKPFADELFYLWEGIILRGFKGY